MVNIWFEILVIPMVVVSYTEVFLGALKWLAQRLKRTQQSIW